MHYCNGFKGVCRSCADQGLGGTRGRPDSTKNHKSIEFLSNIDPDPMKNHKATKPAINGWPSSARQRSAI